MKPISFTDMAAMPIYQSPYVPLVSEEGTPVLAWVHDGAVLVHPDRWDDFLWKMAEVADAMASQEADEKDKK